MKNTTLTVFDPSMCCSTGVCGPDVDPALVQFSSDIEWLESQGVDVERYNLSQEPGAFVEDSDAKAFLERQGESKLPLLKVDGHVIDHGAYPSRETLAEWFEMNEEDSTSQQSDTENGESGGCCSGKKSDKASSSSCC